jgi:hypothetical protein
MTETLLRSTTLQMVFPLGQEVGPSTRVVLIKKGFFANKMLHLRRAASRGKQVVLRKAVILNEIEEHLLVDSVQIFFNTIPVTKKIFLIMLVVFLCEPLTLII